MARGQVVHHKWYANGNPSGRSNQTSIFDTCLFEVEFSGGEITELAASIIAESMYDQCDVNRNEYLLLEAFVDYWKNGSALSIEDKRTVVEGWEVNSLLEYLLQMDKQLHIMGDIIQS